MNTLDNMSRFKVHSIVECIKQYDFCFEIPEVEDDILAYFGIHTFLTEEERRLLIAELTGLAEAFEVSEAVWWACSNEPSLI